MRTIAFFFIAAAALGGVLVAALPAHAQEYPWCAQYGGGNEGGGRNCGFVTYGQCMATVAGVGGFCERNLFYRGPSGVAPYVSRSGERPHRRRHHPRD